MKLLSFRRPDGTPSWGIAKNEGVIDLGARAPGLKHALWAMTSLAEEAARHADFRLERIRGLNFAFFAASGNVLDEVKEQFLSTADRSDWQYRRIINSVRSNSCRPLRQSLLTSIRRQR